MTSNRHIAAAIVTAIAVTCTPTAAADPVSQLCNNADYRDTHHFLCDPRPGGGGPPGTIPGGGGSGSGGLLGLVHRLTGGLL